MTNKQDEKLKINSMLPNISPVITWLLWLSPNGTKLNEVNNHKGNCLLTQQLLSLTSTAAYIIIMVMLNSYNVTYKLIV